jgi:hypothetical protein
MFDNISSIGPLVKGKMVVPLGRRAAEVASELVCAADCDTLATLSVLVPRANAALDVRGNLTSA